MRLDLRAPRRRGPIARSAIGASFALALLALGSCFTYPDVSERLDDDIVLTRFDANASFGSYTTFTVRPDVPLLDGGDAPELLDAASSATLVETVARNMIARGYVRVDAPATADLGLEISITTALNARQVCYPYGYGRSYYWGYSGYSYYAPWGCATSVWTTGTVLVDLLDLRASSAGITAAGSDAGASSPLRAIWFGATYRVLSRREPENLTRAVAGIDQAFFQSPYLRAGGAAP